MIFSAEDIARLFCKQTQIEVLWVLHRNNGEQAGLYQG
jgi:hypothetical protein